MLLHGSFGAACVTGFVCVCSYLSVHVGLHLDSPTDMVESFLILQFTRSTILIILVLSGQTQQQQLNHALSSGQVLSILVTMSETESLNLTTILILT